MRIENQMTIIGLIFGFAIGVLLMMLATSCTVVPYTSTTPIIYTTPTYKQPTKVIIIKDRKKKKRPTHRRSIKIKINKHKKTK
jgi:hypothetical protein